MIELLPLFLIVFYLMPFMIAAARDHAFPVGVLLLNLLLGWTVVGWFAAFVWALVPGQPPDRRIDPSHSARADRPSYAEASPRILDRPAERS